jgi:hypothetical protein
MLLPGAKCRRMARKLRVQYPGAIYHVMNRGDRREAIFTDAEDRHLYLATLGEASEKTDWQIHAWAKLDRRAVVHGLGWPRKALVLQKQIQPGRS